MNKRNKILLKSIRVIDPTNELDQISDITIHGKKIVCLEKANFILKK